MALLTVENVTKHIGGLLVLQDIHLDIEKGEIAGLIGPNGSGKSTLFKAINGFHQIDKGEIYFKDRPICGMKPFRISRMGICSTFQNSQLFSNLTLEESVLMGAYCHEHNKRKALEIAQERIKMVGLEGKETILVCMLNMFERKKAELAAALATNPMLLLLDELFAGLVPAEIEAMLLLVRQLHARYDMTLFIVEHTPRVIMQLCDKIHVLEHGNLIASGTVKEIYENPEVIRAYLGVN